MRLSSPVLGVTEHGRDVPYAAVECEGQALVGKAVLACDAYHPSKFVLFLCIAHATLGGCVSRTVRGCTDFPPLW